MRLPLFLRCFPYSHRGLRCQEEGASPKDRVPKLDRETFPFLIVFSITSSVSASRWKTDCFYENSIYFTRKSKGSIVLARVRQILRSFHLGLCRHVPSESRDSRELIKFGTRRRGAEFRTSCNATGGVRLSRRGENPFHPRV